PNAIARGLKSQRTGLIGAVVPARGEYWQAVVTAFSRRLVERDLHLLIFSFEEAAAVENVLDTVDQYRVDGLVLASSNIGHEHLVRMRRPERPTIVFNQPAASGLLPLITVDNEGGAGLVARHLVVQGARQVLYVGGVATASTDQLRYRGAAQELGAAGIGCAYLEAGDFTYEAGYEIGRRILQADRLPEAIMVGSDEVAFGVIDHLRAARLAIPGDTLVTGFDGLPQASWAGYDLTTLVQPVDVLVGAAIDLLVGTADQHDASEPPTVVVPGALRVGATTDRSKGTGHG
ncbi:MAG: substrate-binding domain-containing protein, partial [Actinomycetota bacterium]